MLHSGIWLASRRDAGLEGAVWSQFRALAEAGYLVWRLPTDSSSWQLTSLLSTAHGRMKAILARVETISNDGVRHVLRGGLLCAQYVTRSCATSRLATLPSDRRVSERCASVMVRTCTGSALQRARLHRIVTCRRRFCISPPRYSGEKVPVEAVPVVPCPAAFWVGRRRTILRPAEQESARDNDGRLGRLLTRSLALSTWLTSEALIELEIRRFWPGGQYLASTTRALTTSSQLSRRWSPDRCRFDPSFMPAGCCGFKPLSTPCTRRQCHSCL